MRITELAVSHRVTVIILMLGVIVTGTFAYFSIPREASPDVQIPIIMVITTYLGVSPADIETSVTMKIEKKLKGLSGVDEIRSTSSESVSAIQVEFLPDVDIDDAYQKVKDKVDLAKSELPEDAEDPMLMEINISEFPIMLVNLSGTCGLARLKELAEKIEDDLEGVRGVLDARLSGGLQREIRIEADPVRLAQYDVPLDALLSLVGRENMSMTAGSIELAEGRYSLRVPAEFISPGEIENLVMLERNGAPIYLRDVSKIVDGFEDPSSRSRVDGKDSVSLSIQKRTGENIVRVSDQIKTVLDRWQTQLPDGTEISLSFDQSKDVRNMVSELENGMISSFILVVAVILFFIGGRNALFISLAVPLSMLITYAVLSAMGITLNMVVLFSLILASGMLVDNAIVIVENIYRHYHLSGNRIEAVLQGTAEVAWPVTTSTLTTVAAFAPLLFWPGIVGDFMSYLPKTVIIALIASLLVALVCNPVLSASYMKLRRKHQKAPAGPRGLFMRTYAGTLRLALRLWPLTIALGVIALIVTLNLYGRYGKGMEFLADTDPNRITIEVEAPQGTSLDGSDVFVREIETIVAQYKNVKRVISNVGSTGESEMSFGGKYANTHQSVIYVDFVDWKEREESTMVTLGRIRDAMPRYPGVDIRVNRQKRGPPAGAPVSIEIAGEDMKTLLDLAGQVKERIKTVPGLIELRDDLERSRPEIQFIVDRERATMLGVDTLSVARTLRMAVYGTEVGTYREGNEEYDIVVRVLEDQRDSLADLETLTVSDRLGKPVPLSSVVRMVHASGFGAIERVDQKKAITVEGDVVDRLPDDVLKEAKNVLADFQLPVGYRISYTGESEEMMEAMSFLGKSFMIALILIAAILVTEFNSLVLSFIVLFSVILSLIGVFWGLMITGHPFSVIMTGIAVIGLAGVVVNNSIVLIDYIGRLRGRGMDLVEALVEAGVTRFRPVMLTAVTTILGLLPMTLGVSVNFKSLVARALNPGGGPLLMKDILEVNSESSQWWGNMASAMAFGLTVATVLTLIQVPTMYLAIERMKQCFAWIFRRSTKTLSILAGLGLGLVAAGSILAEEAPKLSLSQAVNQALESNPQIMAAIKNIEVEQARVRASFWQRLPDLSFNGSVSRMKTSMSSGMAGGGETQDFSSIAASMGINSSSLGDMLSGDDYTSYGARFFLSGPIFSWWRIKNSDAAAALEREMANLALEEMRQDLSLRVTKAFYDVLLAQANKAVAEENLRLNEEHLSRARNRMEAGMATQFDVLRSEVRVTNAKPAILRYGNAEREALQTLNVLMGQAPGKPWVLEGALSPFPLPDLDLTILNEAAETQRPDVLSMGLQLNLLETLVRLAKTNDKPSVAYTGSFGSSTSEVEDLWGDDAESWSVGVSLTWPIFDGFDTIEKVKEAKATLASAQYSCQALLDQVRLALSTSVDAIRISEELIKSTEGNVANAEEALRIAEDNYAVGMATSLDVMEAQIGLSQAKTQVIQALYDELLASAQLLWVTGDLDGTKVLEDFLKGLYRREE